MRLNKSLLAITVTPLLALVLVACNTTENSPVTPQTQTQTGVDVNAFLKAQRGGMLWGDCEVFATVGTPTSFKPGHGNFDEIYNIAQAGGTFKDGIGAISEVVPGDKDFNGGRWHVNFLRPGVDPAKYANACSVEDLDLADFMSTDIYFECPMIPRRGAGFSKAQRGGMLWGDCELFATVGTPATFKPGHGNFDRIFNIGQAGGSFKDGIGAISEAVPGDQDYNGGRWHVYFLKAGVDASKYADACSVEELDMDDWMATDIYFECPMLPRRGNGH